MSRFGIAIALTLSLLGFVCSAQQPSNNASPNLKQKDSPTPPPGPVIGGMGTVNYIPIWAAPTFLLNSVIYQANGGNVGVGTTSPEAKLDVTGNINTSMTYQIGGNSVLNLGSFPSFGNLYVGIGAGNSNPSSGPNTFVGDNAGYSSVGDATFGNSFFGDDAGYSNTIGVFNTFVGQRAGSSNTTGDGNVYVGYLAGANATGNSNTMLGTNAGYNVTTAGGETFVGANAGTATTTGYGNAFFGAQAGWINTTGGSNVFIQGGYYNSTGSNNLYIANSGPNSGNESNTIRIGTQGTGSGQQNTAYIAGIYGVNVGGLSVQIDSNGQLGTQASSLRYKEQVRDMGDSTSALMKLRPVTFFYKPKYAKGDRTLQYGLIAEEVAQVYPELVAYDNDGQPYTVRYQYLSTMLLNEVQKQHRRAEEQAQVINAQQQEIESLKQQLLLQNTAMQQRLSRLEKLVGSQVNVAKE